MGEEGFVSSGDVIGGYSIGNRIDQDLVRDLVQIVIMAGHPTARLCVAIRCRKEDASVGRGVCGWGCMHSSSRSKNGNIVAFWLATLCRDSVTVVRC